MSYAIALLLLCTFANAGAQTLFVDSARGHDTAPGTENEPVATLQKAVGMAGGFTGNQPVTIKIAAGLYVLTNKATIRTATSPDDSADYTIEAAIMHDDPVWQPGAMPVIESVSNENSLTQFPHCVGLLVARNNVHFKGLKFIGNANPGVPYYYPITREDQSLTGLEASQCYFIGERNSAPVQSGIWAHGAGIVVDRCIFYGCKNALVLIKGIQSFSMTKSIVFGAYEAAIWYGPYLGPFVFRDNIVTKCNYVLVHAKGTQPPYAFSHSVFVEDNHYMGYFDYNDELHPAAADNITETDIRRTGHVVLVEAGTNGLPHDYLNLAPESDGRDTAAGIFHGPKK